MLLNRCRRARVLFDVCRYRDRLNILQVAEAGALAPIQELADGMIVSDPRVLVADGDSKKLEISLGRLRECTSKFTDSAPISERLFDPQYYATLSAG
jgi:hypothetical protein